MSMAQALFRRGKRDLALLVKADCTNASGSKHLNALLQHLLNPNENINSAENLDWLRWLISAGNTFEEFTKTVLSYNNATTCGLVWTADFVAYRCRTCGFSPCMSLCSDCFLAGNHDGHDFNMFKSQAGGACDCGNTSVMSSSGFCPKHGSHQAQKEAPPPDLLTVAKLMMPQILWRLILHMRTFCVPDRLDAHLVAMIDAEQFLHFLHQLSDMGAAMQTILSDIMTDSDVYAQLSAVTPESSDAQQKGAENYNAALKSLKFPRVPADFIGKNFGLDSPLKHSSLLEEFLFWTVKFEFPQKLVTLLLSILPVDSYKAAFTKAFMDHYSRISVALVNSSDRSRISSRVLHISVQLLSPESLAVSMMERHNLLPIILGSLWNMMHGIETPSGLNDERGSGRHMVVDCAKEVLKDHCYWPINSDLNSVLSHRKIALAFMQNNLLLSNWVKFIEVFQGMNLNQRELSQHVEYEPETYYAAFSAELEICASPLWALLSHCKEKGTLEHLLNMLRCVLFSLQRWFTAINMRPFSVPNPLQVSFHLPLHRYLAILISHIVLRFKQPLDDILFPTDVLQMLMSHPLQLQVAFYEIFCGMWVRNGLQIRGQAMTYIQCHFCNSMTDADIFLLQLCASRLDPDFFIKTLLQRFHVLDLLTFAKRSEPKRIGFLDPEHQMPLLEGALTTLCMLLGVRTKLGLTQAEVTRLEMVTLLCTTDRTHSQLMDSMPDKCDQIDQTKSFEPILAEVADYKAPNFEAGGGMQQGTYVPKDEIWETDYDPLYVMLRAIYRRDLQTSLDRYTKCIRKKRTGLKTSLWPPFRIPGDIHPEFQNLRRLLHCRTMHGLIFTLLHQAVKEKHLSDPVVYFTLYLLEMTIMIPPPQPPTITIRAPEPRMDKQLDLWYSSADIFQNINQSIPRVSITVFEPLQDGLRVMHPSSRRSQDFSVSDLQLEPSAFSGTSSFIASAAPSTSPNQASLAITHPVSQEISDTVSAMLDEAAMELEASYAVTESSSCRLRNQGVSTENKASKIVDIGVNESMLTLLLKLHDKLSGKVHSYVPETIRGCATDSEMTSRVGDGAFFVAKLLDNICRKNAESARLVEQIYRDGVPSASKGKKKSGEMDKEERRRRAKERQQKLMEQFASKQKEFMENVAGNSDDSDAASADSAPHEEVYDCCICNQSTPSTDTRPVGLVTMLQSTSVLGNRRRPFDNVSLPMRDSTFDGTQGSFGNDMQNRLAILKKDFEEMSWLLSINIGWFGGVHAQSCGHHVHLDCFASYIESLKSQTQQQALRLNQGEFWCPTCRNLCNTALPLINPRGGAVVLAPPADPVKHIRWILHSMKTRPIAPSSSPLTKAMGVVMEDLTNATFSKYKTCTQTCSAEGVLIFVSSVLRTNLELELELRGGSPCNDIESSLASRKLCLLPLIHVLSLHSKILTGSARLFTDLFAHITGFSADEDKVESSVVVYHKEVPVLLKDPSTLLLHLLLTMPSSLTKSSYQVFVQALYNVVYINALIRVTCKFSEEERNAWHRGLQPTSSASSQEALLGHVISLLKDSWLYREDADEPQVPAICQSVWSPQSVEITVQESCLPFLRLASLLQFHLYESPLPKLSKPDPQQEYIHLSDYLGLHKSDGKEACTRTLWHCDLDPLLQAWCSHFADYVKRQALSARMLLSVPDQWNRPQLCSLPRLYDEIFQFYRRKTCNMCDHVPKDPAVCLVCAQLLCFKDRCCQQANVYECVQHSRSCGAGTGIFLIVNSSIVVVVRGPRATAWGSVYLDEHGEEDHYLKRGKPLYLDEARFNLLKEQWLTHSFVRVCKKWIIHSDNL